MEHTIVFSASTKKGLVTLPLSEITKVTDVDVAQIFCAPQDKASAIEQLTEAKQLFQLEGKLTETVCKNGKVCLSARREDTGSTLAELKAKFGK